MLKAVTHFIQQSWLLVVSAFFFGLALAIANAAWAPMIEQNRIDKLNDLMRGLLTEAETFQLTLEGIEVDLGKGRTAKSDIYKALAADGTCIGWAFDCEGAGFADKIELIVAVDENFRKLAGFDVLASNETPGFGDRIKLPQPVCRHTGWETRTNQNRRRQENRQPDCRCHGSHRKQRCGGQNNK